MSWRQILYSLFILLVAGLSTLVGVLAGGIADYQAARQGNC